MKKVAIITLTDNSNFGNRLQNYALSIAINKFGIECETLWKKENVIKKTIKSVKSFFKCKIDKAFKRKELRKNIFSDFTNEYINTFYYSKYEDILKKSYDKFVIGSDQIWSPLALKYYPISLTEFINKENSVASYAPSIGVSSVNNEYILKMKSAYKNNKIKDISVREDCGKKILESILDRNDIEVLIDPTMLLTAGEWDSVSKEPKQVKTLEGKKYILNYFLGDLSQERKNEIERVAKENDCKIINILDKNDPFYVSGPSEFLWLEKNAFLICTDSFHSSVFAILYDRPFIIFDREQKGVENMGSRLDTLINKFKLKNRRFTGKITKENLEHDYSEAYEILEEERKKSDRFLRKALDIEENS